jgi:3-deoxy-D-manno-octulosonic-acid transferase
MTEPDPAPPSPLLPAAIDLAYLAAAAVASPWLLWRFLADGRVRTGLRERLGFPAPRDPARPALWVHGVSVGEVQTGLPLIEGFHAARPGWDVVVSTTTVTGQSVARKRCPGHRVVYFPIDWSGAVARSLDRLRPTAIAQLELELWPNFFLVAARRRIPLFIVNGRITERSVRRFSRIGPVVRRALAGITAVCAQGPDHADRFRAIGVPSDRVVVTGNMKFDSAPAPAPAPHEEPFVRRLGIRPGDPVWVGGSTHAPEEETLARIHARLRARHPRLRLVLVPRHPERSDEVAKGVVSAGLRCYKSSLLTGAGEAPADLADAVVVVDTVGELRKLYAVASLAFLGGSLIPHGGQNMLEPAAVGCPSLFGPHVENFRDIAEALVGAGGALPVADGAALESAVDGLLGRPDRLTAMGVAGMRRVQEGRGATRRALDVLELHLKGKSDPGS